MRRARATRLTKAHRGVWLWLLALLLVPDPQAAPHRGSRFFGWAGIGHWQREPAGAAGQRLLVSPEVKAGFGWTELVLSWNVETPSGTGVDFAVRGRGAQGSTAFYPMGSWTSHPGACVRASPANCADADGEVRTDTLVLRAPWERAQVRLTLHGGTNNLWPRVKFVGLSVLDSCATPVPLPPNRAAWGKVLDVPPRSQVDYPEGVQAWCSPASVSMVLAYWARELRRPELDESVPLVAEAVFDVGWQGTGNWPFNTAFAGAFPGLRAYVTRLTDVAELEAWIARGIPVVVSVCYDQLRGRPRIRDSGHLVVCVGFTSTGDVVVNDPGTRLAQVRRTFARENLIRAWAHSHNTVYLIYPQRHKTPRNRWQHWYRGR
jgi:hypothetical protein